MPLLDHFQPPFRSRWPWSGVHSAWVNTICDELNGTLLPPRYRALPMVQLAGGAVEIDVATLKEDGWEVPTSGPGSWVPPAAAGTATIDFTGPELFEAQVLYDMGGPQLVAAIELVSPANKDRPASRRAFALKCANYLEQGTSVIVVDVVTERAMDLHAELLTILELGPAAAWTSPTGLYAIAYRSQRENAHINVDWWPEALAIGSPLAKLPLWIALGVQVPIDLEATYVKTFERLRMPLENPVTDRNGQRPTARP